jgi:hypothetical protein
LHRRQTSGKLAVHRLERPALLHTRPRYLFRCEFVLVLVLVLCVRCAERVGERPAEPIAALDVRSCQAKWREAPVRCSVLHAVRSLQTTQLIGHFVLRLTERASESQLVGSVRGRLWLALGQRFRVRCHCSLRHYSAV